MVTITAQDEMDNSNTNGVVEIGEENRRNSFSRKSRGRLLHSISIIVVHALDLLFLGILLPFMLWQWVSASYHKRIVLKAVAEVTLELLMWVVFAGVSILLTTTFVVEDIYFRKNDAERLRQLLSDPTGSAMSDNPDDDKNTRVSESITTGKDKSKVPDN